MSNNLSYVSLFSSAGLGCYGFKQAGFNCLATVELLERRINVQRANQVADMPSAYISGDITKPEIHGMVMSRVNDFKFRNPGEDVTAVIATPPCQGMSVANHKKHDNEIIRNSLVLESLDLIDQIRPKVFVLENVRSFLSSLCNRAGEKPITIAQAIQEKLGPRYLVHSRVVNLRDFGSPSSRTRTLVIGTLKSMQTVPADLFPARLHAASLIDLIGHLPSLSTMGEISDTDHLHGFRRYKEHMRDWIHNLNPGESAFDNADPQERPHQIINGNLVENKSSNGDKYRRQLWDKVPPCVHTRNDILASQNTVHPVDDRVFSIRELMLFMGVPETFRWSEDESPNPNAWPLEKKQEFLRTHEMNIRQCLGEGVPTPVFRSIAENIRATLHEAPNVDEEIYKYTDSIDPKKLDSFYTSRVAAFCLSQDLPSFTKKKIKILEPSVGTGALLRAIGEKYKDKTIDLTIVDVDVDALSIAQSIADSYGNITLTSLNSSFLDLEFKENEFDLVIGNPPFSVKLPARQLSDYSSKKAFAVFLEKACRVGRNISFIIPKSFLSAPDYWSLRNKLSAHFHVRSIFDFGMLAFSDVKIETIGLTLYQRPKDQLARDLGTRVASFIIDHDLNAPQSYITDPSFPTWVIYRNDFFDQIVTQCNLGAFDVYRDRSITKKNSSSEHGIPVLKARDIAKGEIHPVSEPSFIAEKDLPNAWKKIADNENLIVVPNLTYYPRAAFLPDGVVPDGSAAVLVPRNSVPISGETLLWFSSETFYFFYRIARNFSTRTLNVDRCSVFYWCIPKNLEFSHIPQMQNNPRSLFPSHEIYQKQLSLISLK
ncbi:DNA cytosine methyltransferase [Glutamicibacter sp. AGC13]